MAFYIAEANVEEAEYYFSAVLGISPHYDVAEFEQDLATLEKLGML